AARVGVDLAVRAGAEATARGVVDSEAARVLGQLSTDVVSNVDASALEAVAGQALTDESFVVEQAALVTAPDQAGLEATETWEPQAGDHTMQAANPGVARLAQDEAVNPSAPRALGTDR